MHSSSAIVGFATGRAFALGFLLAITGLVAGCSVETPTTPVAPSSLNFTALTQVAPSSEEISTLLRVPPSDQITPLGGLDLDGYCQSLGYTDSTLTKPQVGPNAAYNNWRCRRSDGSTHPFSMAQACKWQYGMNAVQTHPTDPDDAFTWVAI